MALTAGYLRSVGVVPWNDRQGSVVAIDGLQVTEKFVDASTIVATAVAAGQAGPNTTTASMLINGTLATGGVALFVYARCVIITVTHGSSIVACNGVISGCDIYGNLITEAWSVTATGTSKTYQTGKAFKNITGITMIAASDASANTIAAGDSKGFGLAYVAANQAIIGELQDTAVPTAGAIVAGTQTTLKDSRGIYTPNATLDGAKDFTLTYLLDSTVKQFQASVA